VGVSQKMGGSEALPRGLESALLAGAEDEDLPRVPEILRMAKQVYLGETEARGGGWSARAQGTRVGRRRRESPRGSLPSLPSASLSPLTSSSPPPSLPPLHPLPPPLPPPPPLPLL